MFYRVMMLENVGRKEVGVKIGSEEKYRIAAVLTVTADGGKLPPLTFFKGKSTEAGKTKAANSIEREFLSRKGKKRVPLPPIMSTP